jgi:hypothetical protein
VPDSGIRVSIARTSRPLVAALLTCAVHGGPVPAPVPDSGIRVSIFLRPALMPAPCATMPTPRVGAGARVLIPRPVRHGTPLEKVSPPRFSRINN